VCDEDPFCCGVEWDQLCADLALELCQGSCPGEGDCFQPHGTPGCADEECCKKVCLEDIFCCAVQWDEDCAFLAVIQCVCPSKGNCIVPHPFPGCEDEECCQAVCEIDPFCCQVEWDGICAGEAYELCDIKLFCGSKKAGSCFDSHSTPFCNDETCCDAVCEIHPFCCETGWDSTCTIEADGLCTPGCGDKGTGSCFEQHGPFCDDADCCKTVCSVDPFCCDVAWDGICVNEAFQFCVASQAPCPGDIDHNGVVDVTDLITAIMDIGCAAPARCQGDVTLDGACDVQDMMLVLKTWGKCP
jgi:hypothetical protein